MTEEKKYKVGLISLGCDKNRVDGEKMLSRLQAAGYEITTDLEQCDVVLINTCGFIESARKESFSTINEVLNVKENQKVVVTGCLPKIVEREMLKGVDLLVDLGENESIVEKVSALLNVSVSSCDFENRILSTPKGSAFLKIADGCNNNCAYCTIPKIRGHYTSVAMEALLTEARSLVKAGVKEIILVAQDVTRYGKDLYGKYMLVPLIQELSKVKGLEWIRLHYCYPELVDDNLISEIAGNDKVCKYIDLPFQHISDKILKKMFRRNTMQQAVELVNKLKEHNISIRSTFIVGFPGEEKEDFNALVKFIKKYKLNNVGFFAYSKEEKTVAYDLPQQVSEKEKIKRLKRVQKVQTKILLKNQRKLKGKVLKVLCEGYDNDEELYIGRDERNSYNVDTIVLFAGENVQIGKFYDVKIITNLGIDLLGEKV